MPIKPNAELLTRLLEATESAVLVFDAAQRVRYANSSVRTMFGYSPEELFGQSLDILLPEDAVETHREHVRRFGAEARHLNMAHRVPVTGRRRDGTIFQAQIGLSAIPIGAESWCAAIINDLTLNRSAALALKQKTDEVAIMHERARIAQVFQDITSQTLFSAKITSEILPRVIQRDPAEAVRLAQNISRMTAGAMAQLRVVLIELRPGEIAANPISELLHVLAEASASRIGRPISVTAHVSAPPPTAVCAAVYRVAQEALHNACTHSGAQTISAVLEANDAHVELVVIDNGRGAPLDRIADSVTGFRTMREQASAIDGHLNVWSAPGQGTRVTLTWRANAQRPVHPASV